MMFKDVWVLLFLPLIILFVYLLKKREVHSSIRFSSTQLLEGFRPTFKILLAKNLVYLKAAVLLLFFFALARPVTPIEETKIKSEGIDIVLAIDSSGSMLAEDFKTGLRRINRLKAVKGVVREFIRARKDDRIGMIAFAAYSFTVCPLTLDYPWLIENLERVEIGAIADGTAIGSAISSSLNRLKNTEAKSKIIILLTDGANNAGKISPFEAANIAKTLGIKIYTIGAGKKGLVPYPVQGLFGRTVYQNVEVRIDEDVLKQIAKITGGKYFRATDTKSLRDIYKEIDSLEKTEVQQAGYLQYRQLFPYFLIVALTLLVLDIILSNTLLRKLP